MNIIEEMVLEESEKLIRTTTLNSDGSIRRIAYIDPTTNKFHRINGPALEYFDGEAIWIYKGKYHRVGGPAMYNKKEKHYVKKWYFNGQSFESKEEYFDKIPFESQKECILSVEFFSS